MTAGALRAQTKTNTLTHRAHHNSTALVAIPRFNAAIGRRYASSWPRCCHALAASAAGTPGVLAVEEPRGAGQRDAAVEAVASWRDAGPLCREATGAVSVQNKKACAPGVQAAVVARDHVQWTRTTVCERQTVDA